MAKKQDTATMAEPQAMQIEAAPPVLKKFQVSLNCPTPLAHRSAVIAAVDGSAAKVRFFEINGISGTDHAFEIVEVADDVAETVPV